LSGAGGHKWFDDHTPLTYGKEGFANRSLSPTRGIDLKLP
jgi:hypothetical protein